MLTLKNLTKKIGRIPSFPVRTTKNPKRRNIPSQKMHMQSWQGSWQSVFPQLVGPIIRMFFFGTISSLSGSGIGCHHYHLFPAVQNRKPETKLVNPQTWRGGKILSRINHKNHHVHGQGWSKRVQLIIFIANCRQKYWKSGMQRSNELTNNTVIVKHVIPTTTIITSPTLLSLLRASPPVLSMWQTVKFIAKKLKCAGLAQEIGFSAPNLCSLPWLVKGATQLCTSKKE
jgi:hypothetical protein